MRAQIKFVGRCAVVFLSMGALRAQVTSVSGQQTATQPVASGSQTYLGGNTMSGFKYASRFQSGVGNNGITNAFGSAAGQTVIAEPAYSTAEQPFFESLFPNQSHLVDYRAGGQVDLYVNPLITVPHTTTYPSHYQSTTFTETPHVGTGSNAGFVEFDSNSYFNGQGYDLGNNRTTAQGWSVQTAHNSSMVVNQRGISSLIGGNLNKNAIGDTEAFVTYMSTFGGEVATSDEGIAPLQIQNQQITAFPIGTCSSGCSVGSTQVTASLSQGGPFNDGGYLLDVTQGGANTATIAGVGTVLGGLYADLSGVSLTPSTAWGNIDPTSCTNNGSGQYQVYVSTTCNVVLGTSPASPGSFVAGEDIFLSGHFEEEALVTAVGAVSMGKQSITFNTRYAWDNAHGSTDAALVMQGGIFGASITGSQGFIQTGSSAWPIAYPVVGAVSSTRLIFGNCALGNCDAAGGSTGLSRNILRSGGITFYPLAEITGTDHGASNIAQLATNTIPFTSSDTLWGAPASEYHFYNHLVYGQTTPIDLSDASVGLELADTGPTPVYDELYIKNGSGNLATNLLAAAGAYTRYFDLNQRPTEVGTTPGAVLSVGLDNNAPTAPYNVFEDRQAAQSNISFNPGNSWFSIPQLQITRKLQIVSGTFGALAACSGATEGMQAPVTDSTTNTWGATVTGGGSDHVLAYCDGTDWTVEAK